MVKKKVIKQKVSAPKENNVEKILIENFISFQKVMVNMSEKLENLTDQM